MAKKINKAILPWLSKNVTSDLMEIISKTIITELKKRFWGDWASGTSAGGGYRILINDFRGLMMAIGTIRYFLTEHNVKLLYRGQTVDWDLKPSLFRNSNSKEDVTKNMEWNKAVLDYLKDKFDSKGKNDDFREALLQHYGMKTTWIDAVDHIQTACWFASNDKGIKEYISGSKEHKIDSDVGFIYLLGIPEESNKYAKYIDLRQKPSEWLRPHIQQAYAVRLIDPSTYGTFINHLCVITFVVPKILLSLWSNSSIITEDIIYPHYNHDRGIKHFNAAIEKLKKAKISIDPPI